MNLSNREIYTRIEVLRTLQKINAERRYREGFTKESLQRGREYLNAIQELKGELQPALLTTAE